MGKESREREETEAVGRYNARVTLLFIPVGEDYMKEETVLCKQWVHAGPFLALTLFNGTLRIVCLQQYHGFTVNAIDQQTLENMHEESTLRN